jgi:hypothetical protein
MHYTVFDLLVLEKRFPEEIALLIHDYAIPMMTFYLKKWNKYGLMYGFCVEKSDYYLEDVVEKYPFLEKHVTFGGINDCYSYVSMDIDSQVKLPENVKQSIMERSSDCCRCRKIVCFKKKSYKNVEENAKKCVSRDLMYGNIFRNDFLEITEEIIKRNDLSEKKKIKLIAVLKNDIQKMMKINEKITF